MQRSACVLLAAMMLPLEGLAAGAPVTAAAAATAGSAPVANLSPIVVTATRYAESSFDVPASIDVVSQAEIQEGQLQENISESLMTVPGVSAENRQNYAQDLQLSVRGFGARSSFGVRGVRLYSDGIPGTMPDGQGEFSQFDLGSAGRMEVLRGPFSALYGNSSGGVISLFTEEAPAGYYIDGTAQYGTFDTQRYALKSTGDAGIANYVVDAVHFQTNGYRYHSKAERENFNSVLRLTFNDAAKLTLVGNAVQTPFVQDPLGLTKMQLYSNPSQAGTGAIPYNTRKSLNQEQGGAILDYRFSAEDALSSTVYVGHRATTQYQSIPQAVEEKEPLYPGGVINLERAFYGIDTHVTDQRTWDDMRVQTVGGIAYDDLEETRLGYLNYVGDELGVEGALRRDEANHVYDFDQYLQTQWDPDALWRVTAGVRNNLVEVSSNDHLPGTTEPHSSVRYTAVSPVGAVLFQAAPKVNLYASYGKGFETPTLNDLAYRSVNGSLPGHQYLAPARAQQQLRSRGEGRHGSDSRRARRLLHRDPRRARGPAELQRTHGRAEHRRDRAPRRGSRRRRERGGRLLRPGRIHLHPRRGGSGLHHVRGNAVSARHGRARELLARRTAECPVSGYRLELRAAGIFDHARGAGTGRNLRR